MRVAKGEELDTAEQAIYEAGVMDLDAEETTQWKDSDLTMLRRLKSEVESLETTRLKLLGIDLNEPVAIAVSMSLS